MIDRVPSTTTSLALLSIAIRCFIFVFFLETTTKETVRLKSIITHVQDAQTETKAIYLISDL